MDSVTDFREADIDTVLRLAAIVEFSDDAILSKDLSGIVTSWNAAASRLFGYSADEIVGKSVTLLIPPELADEELAILERMRRDEPIEHYETVRVAKDGTRYDVSLSISPLRNVRGQIVGASTIARNITERKHAESLLRRQQRRLEQIDRISKLIAGELDLDRVAQTVIDIATQVSGARFGAFLYDFRDGEDHLLFASSGVDRCGFQDFLALQNAFPFELTFRTGSVVRFGDIREDPRCNGGLAVAGTRPMVSYLAIPLAVHDGDVAGGLFFGHNRPGHFTQETEADVSAIAAHADIAISNAKLHRAAQEEIARRRKAEEAMDLMLHEIRHRVKNSLGIVQAIVNQTFKDAPQEQRRAFGARLQALSAAHDLLTLHRWHRTSLSDIVRHAVEPFEEHGCERFLVSGPGIELEAGNALLLAMVFHELGTNAVKYGALSKTGGRVEIGWNLDDRPDHLLLTWRESGGPPVAAPARKGFGSKLMERALRAQGGAVDMDFAPAGLVCRLDVIVRRRNG